MLKLKPINLREANAFIEQRHRHHKRARGCKAVVGVEKEGQLVGVAILGRPNARMIQDGYTAEVTRLCTDGTRNACSILYATMARAARDLGFRRVVTYILDSETGISVKAAGWKLDHVTTGGSWSRPSRRRTDKAPTVPKMRWSKTLSA